MTKKLRLGAILTIITTKTISPYDPKKRRMLVFLDERNTTLVRLTHMVTHVHPRRWVPFAN